MIRYRFPRKNPSSASSRLRPTPVRTGHCPGYDLGDGVASNGQGSIFVARGIIRAIDANNHRSDDAFVTRSDSSLCAQ